MVACDDDNFLNRLPPPPPQKKRGSNLLLLYIYSVLELSVHHVLHVEVCWLDN